MSKRFETSGSRLFGSGPDTSANLAACGARAAQTGCRLAQGLPRLL
jgi:hypothetical protein